MLREKNAQTRDDGTELVCDNSELAVAGHGQDPITIGDLARQTGVTLRALRFYQSKGLLAPQRNGSARIFSHKDRERLELVLQGKRLGFTLFEIRQMLAVRDRGCTKSLPIGRKKCIEQIRLLENQRRDVERALAELRQIYTGMFLDVLPPAGDAVSEVR